MHFREVCLIDELIVWLVPLIIPAILVGSWLVNHKTPSSGGDSSASKSAEEKKAPEVKKEERLSDKDMTSS